MKMILHHLRKDIRALRITIATWLLMLLVIALPEVLLLQPDYAAAREADNLPTYPLAALAACIAWTVLLARLVQSEPMTGSTSFWLTRPIPPGAQLMSRAIFFTIVMLLASFLPIASHAVIFSPDWLLIKQQVLTLGMIELIAAIVVVWVAAFSRSLLHFIGALCFGFTGVVLALLINDEFGIRRGGTNSDFQGSFLPLLILLPGLLLSIVVQRIWRGSFLGWRIGLAAYGLAWIAQCVVAPPITWDPFRDDLETVSVDFAPDWSKSVAWVPPGNPYPEDYTAYATFNPNAMVSHEQISVTFEPPGEPKVDLGETPSVFGTEDVLNLRPLIDARLPGITVANPARRAEPNRTILFSMLPAAADKWRGRTGKLTLDVKGQVLQIRSVVAIPLDHPSAIGRIPGGFIRVRPVQLGNGWLKVWTLTPQRSYSGFGVQFAYVLVDPQKRTGQILELDGAPDDPPAFGLERGDPNNCEINYLLSGKEPLNRMVLYAFEVTPAKNFETVLTAPDFTMQPPK
jgi:hypothetical protein